MAVSISPVDPQGINQLVIDATLRIDHEYTNRPTEYPIEDGAIISDHIRQSPERITLEIVTTNSPVVVNIDNTGKTQIRVDQSNRKQLAFNTWLEYAGYEINKQADAIEGQVNEPQLLNIVTDLKVYTNMVITNLSMPENRSINDAIIASVSFQKIKKATTEFFVTPDVSELNGKAPNIENQAAKKTDVGKQQSKEADNNSILFNLTLGEAKKAKVPTGSSLITGAAQ
jgi:hypothetical protein